MYDNELIMYVDPYPVTYYDMFILMFSRWKLEQEDKIGETFEWYVNQVYDFFSVSEFINKGILIEIEDDLYTIDDNFMAKQFFVSIDKKTAIYLYEILDKLEKEAADFLLGLYIFFLSKSRVKAYKEDLENVRFGIRSICKFLNCSYTEKDKKSILNCLAYLEQKGLISYSKINKKYMFPYELDGVLVEYGKDLMNVKQIYQRFYE